MLFRSLHNTFFSNHIILPAIRTGKNYMITKESIMEFQKNYAGLDVSNRVKAIEAYRLVKNRLEA